MYKKIDFCGSSIDMIGAAQRNERKAFEDLAATLGATAMVNDKDKCFMEGNLREWLPKYSETLPTEGVTHAVWYGSCECGVPDLEVYLCREEDVAKWTRLLHASLAHKRGVWSAPISETDDAHAQLHISGMRAKRLMLWLSGDKAQELAASLTQWYPWQADEVCCTVYDGTDEEVYRQKEEFILDRNCDFLKECIGMRPTVGYYATTVYEWRDTYEAWVRAFLQHEDLDNDVKCVLKISRASDEMYGCQFDVAFCPTEEAVAHWREKFGDVTVVSELEDFITCIDEIKHAWHLVPVYDNDGVPSPFDGNFTIVSSTSNLCRFHNGTIHPQRSTTASEAKAEEDLPF